MLENTDVEEVWFVVSPQNPFKERGSLLPDLHRLQTLAHLRELYPDREFCLIMGSDNLDHFDRWRNYQYILDNYHIYVYPRPGHMDSPLLRHPSVTLLGDFPLMAVSSSYIRGQIARGHDVRYLLTEPVWKYLTEMHFYEKGNPGGDVSSHDA